VPRKQRAATKPRASQAQPGRARPAADNDDAQAAPLSAEDRKRLADLFALMRRVLETHAAYEDPRRTPGGHALSDEEVRHFVTQTTGARLRLERALLRWEERAGKLYDLMRTDAERERGRPKKLAPGVFAEGASQVWVPSTDQLWDIAASRCERCLGDPQAFDSFAQAVHELVRLGAVTQTITDARLKKAIASSVESGREGGQALDVLATATGVAKNKIVAACARAVGRAATLAPRQPPQPPAQPAAEPWERRREQTERLIAEAIERGKQRARERALQGRGPAEPKPE
jgi:hypothetical protein